MLIYQIYVAKIPSSVPRGKIATSWHTIRLEEIKMKIGWGKFQNNPAKTKHAQPWGVGDDGKVDIAPNLMEYPLEIHR